MRAKTDPARGGMLKVISTVGLKVRVEVSRAAERQSPTRPSESS